MALNPHSKIAFVHRTIEDEIVRAGCISGILIEKLTPEILSKVRTDPRWTFEISDQQLLIRIAYAYGSTREAIREIMMPPDDLASPNFYKDLLEAILSVQRQKSADWPN
jgi:hypothetical protein